MQKRKPDTIKERNMYVICLGILAIVLVTLFSLSGPSSFKNLITGAVVTEEAAIEEAITQEEALESILQAEKDIQEMQGAGFNTAWAADTLIEAKKYFEGEDYTELLKDLLRIKDLEKREKARSLIIEAQEKIGYAVNYEKVLELTKSIQERKTGAYEISDQLSIAESKIQELEGTEETLQKTKRSFVGRAFGLGAEDTKEPVIDTTSLDEILSKAQIEFKEERYDNAVELLSQIEPEIEDLRSENTLLKVLYRAGKETTFNFIKEHYIALFIALIVLVAVSLLSYNRVMVGVLDRRIGDMNVEQEVLTDLMKKAQTERYSTGKMSKQTYDTKMAKYKEKKQQIKQKLPVVQARKDKLSQMKRLV